MILKAQNFGQQNILTTTNGGSQTSNGPTTTTVSLSSPPGTSRLAELTIQQQQPVNNAQSAQSNQQHQQNTQQQIYYVYQDSGMDAEGSQADFEGSNLTTHTAQAAPITIQWLIDNFEPAEGCSLRRSTLYNYYLHHCDEQRLEPVNPASFGKLIRSVFLGLRTRRLGTR